MNSSSAGPETVGVNGCPLAHPPSGDGDAGPGYSDLLRLDELLALPPGPTELHDEHLFYVAHMIYELWFKVILDELECARDSMFTDDVPRALYCLRRVGTVERVLVGQVEVLETISPGSFAKLRPFLYQASGIQSVQFREIEFLSGLKDEHHLARGDLRPADRASLKRRLAEPSLGDAFRDLRRRHGDPDLAELLRVEIPDSDLLAVAEALTDHDELFSIWRSRHVHMVERIIGAKPGTGGSSGVHYLRSTLNERFFPELWEMRTRL
ncbi:tryptophan 2,3-dioxygenase [Streptomyces ovatisporus]|uniref:Tryptophan 2,3-dioxygenase n=1 Tax=Streptomyces ovatisporus TaxID=1128682 RepID=A0ABV9A787_9ACTN